MIRPFLIALFALLILANKISGQEKVIKTDTIVYDTFEHGDSIVTLSEVVCIYTDTIIKLSKEIKGDKIIILLNNKDFEITISYSDFIEYLNKYPRHYDKKLIEEVQEKVKQSKNLNVSINKISSLNDRVEFIIADLLKNEKCLILNKRENKTVPEINYQTYRANVVYGRRILANNTLILKTVDIRGEKSITEPIVKITKKE